ncbi:AzlC family ABC transporter permease [Lentilactobacillus sp. SPB1-3]|uniref:AzlC family ABC transporter permease n=1 Tax=Lentilactobacillus terminaliae TaxID=3003483 RepID=A0ACD5DF68_9LACO|nr:AzlC family ABC transporter permease [Lentilactobacillus sp. SPB1-3]MCZ0976386.1 AzlC family ABC transporter permease [Lentilactobacillus sp. SPB1-3]
MNQELSARAGLKDVVPTLVGYIGVGLAFGIVAKAANLSVLVVFIMSLLVYAGAGQFLIVSMLTAGAPVVTIAISVLLINARMSLMSMTVAPYLKKESLLKYIGLGSLLTDETFALSMNKLNYTDRQLNGAWLNTANIVAYLVWALSTVVGAVLGSAISDPKVLGLDFAVVAMFIGLLYLQMIADHSKPLIMHLEVAGFVMVSIFVLMRFMPGNTAILVGTILGCLFGMAVEKK